MNLLAPLAALALSLSANGPSAIFQGSPADVVQIIRYNAAHQDLWLQDRRGGNNGGLEGWGTRSWAELCADGVGSFPFFCRGPIIRHFRQTCRIRIRAMKIHEFQGKELFRKAGVAVLRGKVARSPDEAATAFTELAS